MKVDISILHRHIRALVEVYPKWVNGKPDPDDFKSGCLYTLSYIDKFLIPSIESNIPSDSADELYVMRRDMENLKNKLNKLDSDYKELQKKYKATKI